MEPGRSWLTTATGISRIGLVELPNPPNARPMIVEIASGAASMITSRLRSVNQVRISFTAIVQSLSILIPQLSSGQVEENRFQIGFAHLDRFDLDPGILGQVKNEG